MALIWGDRRRFIGFREGYILGRGFDTYVLPSAGSYAVTVAIPDLKQVAWILKWGFHTNPVCSHGTVENEGITGNVVGCTLVGVAAGTTLNVEVVAVGL